MALNIKNPEVHRLASQLAQQNGESLTMTILISLQERLERQENSARKESRMEWLERITKETAAVMNDGRTSKELMDELYDEETGLPK